MLLLCWGKNAKNIGHATFALLGKRLMGKIILDSVDEIVHHALRAQATARALEKLAEENGVEHTGEKLVRYIALAEEEELKFNDYEYEPLED